MRHTLPTIRPDHPDLAKAATPIKASGPFPVMRGQTPGGDDYACGECDELVIESMEPTAAVNHLIMVCGYCGAYNYVNVDAKQ